MEFADAEEIGVFVHLVVKSVDKSAHDSLSAEQLIRRLSVVGGLFNRHERILGANFATTRPL
jgi:hypothetical protein